MDSALPDCYCLLSWNYGGRGALSETLKPCSNPSQILAPSCLFCMHVCTECPVAFQNSCHWVKHERKAGDRCEVRFCLLHKLALGSMLEITSQPGPQQHQPCWGQRRSMSNQEATCPFSQEGTHVRHDAQATGCPCLEDGACLSAFQERASDGHSNGRIKAVLRSSNMFLWVGGHACEHLAPTTLVTWKPHVLNVSSLRGKDLFLAETLAIRLHHFCLSVSDPQAVSENHLAPKMVWPVT